jgi:hypothetical protein
MPPEAWKTSVTVDKEAASLTKLFNTFRDRDRDNFQENGKLH